MRTHLTLLPAVVLCLGLGAFVTHAPAADRPVLPPAKPASRDWNLRQTPVVEVVKRVRAAVVNIHSERTVRGPATEELFSHATSQNRINGMGTGIIIDPRGYIVTNHHVVEEVNVIRARLADGTALTAKVVARDPENDLALLKIDAGRPLQTMPLGTASDLMVGETVIAVGNAYGYEHSVTVGVVSATNRDVTLNKEMSYKALIQTDASINPGNSGGPLLNVHGDLIGVNVAIRAGAQGIGFAIPVDTMIRVASKLLNGRGKALSHGLIVKDQVQLNHEDNPARSVVVERVDPNGPAAKAGVQRGDVLLRVDDQDVITSLDLERALLEHALGDKIQVVVRRETEEKKAELVLESGKNIAQPVDVAWRKLGVRLQPVAAETVVKNHPQLHGGMVIADLKPEGVASKAGLQKGDILVGLHQWEMLNPENVSFVLGHPDLNGFLPLRFYILRAGQVHRGFFQNLD